MDVISFADMCGYMFLNYETLFRAFIFLFGDGKVQTPVTLFGFHFREGQTTTTTHIL